MREEEIDEDTKKLIEKGAQKIQKDWDEKYPLMNTRLAVPVDFEIDREKYPRKSIRGMGRVAQMALVATDNALADSGMLGNEEITQGRTGIAYGSSIGSVDSLMEMYSMLVTNDIIATGLIGILFEFLPDIVKAAKLCQIIRKVDNKDINHDQANPEDPFYQVLICLLFVLHSDSSL